MVKYWIFVAKEVLKNLNEVPWNDSGTETILPNTKTILAFRAFKTIAKVTWTQHGRKSGAKVLPEVDLGPVQMPNFSWAEPNTLN